MELLLSAAALLALALLAVVAPLAGVDSRGDEPTWPGAPLSGREVRRRFDEESAARNVLSRC
jgi:hypothetical protein